MVKKCRLQNSFTPLHSAQCDPVGTPEPPEISWGCAQPSNEYRAVPTGAALTCTVTAHVRGLSCRCTSLLCDALQAVAFLPGV